MSGDRVRVSATAGGYLVSTRTGRQHAVTDLGAVWDSVAPANSPSRVELNLPRLKGIITLPPLRPALTRVILLVENGNVGDDPVIPPDCLDARDLNPASLANQLRELVDKGRPPEIRVLVTPGQIEQLVGMLRAHPARPFAVTEIRNQAEIRPTKSSSCFANSDFSGTMPALFAWLAALDVAGNQLDKQFRVELVDSRVLAVDVLRGTVTRCELLPITCQAGGHARCRAWRYCARLL